MAGRAGLPPVARPPEAADDDDDMKKNRGRDGGTVEDEGTERRSEAERRKAWEATFRKKQGIDKGDSSGKDGRSPMIRSALGERQKQPQEPERQGNNSNDRRRKSDLFSNRVLDPDEISRVARENTELKRTMHDGPEGRTGGSDSSGTAPGGEMASATLVSEYVAKSGSGNAFEGRTLGIGGLDDALSQIRRRVWIPLAAPPRLLKELGIRPVRGLLLYGKPGCGKTLLASKLGHLLSPLRPITIVSGPEIMDKFVGSSEKNLRAIFDVPPEIYDRHRLGRSPDECEALSRTALHVVVMDEFDAIARSRGGRMGSGENQGDAGVARDSVVNQLLAKMDGVDPLVVPTLVIGLTNRRSLIEPALLRPGRFEVQIEIPPPRTLEQRIDILRVHTRDMHRAGRLLVSDAPEGSPAASLVSRLRCDDEDELPPSSYGDLLRKLAGRCGGFSGASLAGVCRAAASHALERAVEEFAAVQADATSSTRSLLEDCVVTEGDFDAALEDVLESQGDSDWSTDDDDGDGGDLDDDGASDDGDDGEIGPGDDSSP